MPFIVTVVIIAKDCLLPLISKQQKQTAKQSIAVKNEFHLYKVEN